MSLKMFQILVPALLFTGVLGAPFLTEESANQFIRLKRQMPYSQNYWDPSSSQNAWGYTVAEQVFLPRSCNIYWEKKKCRIGINT
ncbi:uncharacterized protein C3orf85 homolog [Apteryx rowi]|uniref:uncharacterized protein C3orf85 homolog n=1 Tax=Apteryx rowi TaxID=308060 RepID=UPI000E1DEE78|nr:uncharacterized protein C3orf85 homolog [Apteryx rowi]